MVYFTCNNVSLYEININKYFSIWEAIKNYETLKVLLDPSLKVKKCYISDYLTIKKQIAIHN